jgi:hypothetical protein
MSITCNLTGIELRTGCYRREVLYNLLIEFCIPMTLAGLIKVCLNETYSKVRIGKYLSDETR